MPEEADSPRAAPDLRARASARRLLTEALAGLPGLRERGVRAALFEREPGYSLLRLGPAFGFSEEILGRTREQLVFEVGAERGLVGRVASSGRPAYVASCARDERWIGSGRSVGIASAYLLPLAHSEGGADVLCLLSPVEDAFDAPTRAVADLVGELVARHSAMWAELNQRLGSIEREARRLLLELNASRDGGAATPSPSLREGLRRLSAREWEILERVQAGQRIDTIAQGLSISPYTVRNHVKSICRKLGVARQAELRERLGALPRELIRAWRH